MLDTDIIKRRKHKIFSKIWQFYNVNKKRQNSKIKKIVTQTIVLLKSSEEAEDVVLACHVNKKLPEHSKLFSEGELVKKSVIELCPEN